MSIDVAHLVLESPGNANNQVVDDGADCAKGSRSLAGSMVQLDRDGALARATKRDGDVGKVLDQFASRSLDGDDSRLNVNLHYKQVKE